MESGRPPSSRPSDAELQRLETTRGAVRDALSAIRNLHELLRSINVGPRAIGDVVPDVHAASRSFVGYARDLLDDVGKHLEDSECLDSLVDYLTPPVSDLQAALGRAMAHPMNAKSRLALERVVGNAADQIQTVLSLVNLMEESVSGRVTAVDASDLVRQALSPLPNAASSESVPVTFAPAPGAIDVEVNARAAAGLVIIAVGVIHDSTGTAPHLSVTKRDGEVLVRIEAGPGTGEVHDSRPPRLAPPSCPCALAAADLAGIRLRMDEDRSVASISFEC